MGGKSRHSPFFKMEKTLAIFAGLVLGLSAFAQATNKTITVAWDHDGQNLDGFLLIGRFQPNTATPIASIGKTNRVFTFTLTNPPAELRLALVATNAWGASAPSEDLVLSPPLVTPNLRIVSVITVQIP